MKRKINKIIIHCSATPPTMDVDANRIDEWHKEKGWSGIGYHFFIKRDGQIEIGRPLEKQGAHTRGHNKNSIGVCYAGGVDSEMCSEDNRTSNQIASLLSLLRLLKNIFPESKVHSHNDFSPKDCPSFNATKEYNSL
jgi:N-acetylmuramoyl-L-alanine amidase|tara:strand:+ start:545 stop:955 length:411 start_codon:yes stop_codon:yes gene_type:complete